METIEKMITILAWISVVVCPLYITIMVYLQKEYEGSISKELDRIKGLYRDFTTYIPKAGIITVISIVYLIASN